jgi:hypothetical protein
MNQKQIDTFRLVENILEENSFRYAHCIDGPTHCWYRGSFMAELVEGETLTFYKDNLELVTLSNNFNIDMFLIFKHPMQNPITENSLKSIIDDLKG